MSLRSQPPSIVDFYNPYINAKDAHGRTREQILLWNNDELERSHDYIQILFPLPEGSMFSYTAPIIDKKIMEEFRTNGHLQMTLGQAFDRMMRFYGFEIVSTPDLRPSACQADDDAAAKDRKKHSEEGEGESKAAKIETHVEDRIGATTSVDAVPSVEIPRNSNSSEMPVASPGAQRIRVVRASNFEERSKNWCVRIDHNHLRISRILRSLRVLGLQRQCEAFFEALADVYNDPTITIGRSSMMFWKRAAHEPLHIAPDGTECKWLKML